jgi:predicted transcriptional regulator of viral defense system
MHSVGLVLPDLPARSARAGWDRAIARLAARQHGVVTLAQLLALGMSPSTVRDRVAAGRLHRVHRGVFAVGHLAIGPRGHWTAAVMACGPGAVLSHRSTAALWAIRESSSTVVDVTCATRAGRRRRGIVVHRADTLDPADVTEVDGIPCTTVARTVLDLAGVLGPGALEYTIHRAQSRRLLDRTEVERAIDRSPTRRGTAVVRRILGIHGLGEEKVKSELERRFLRICSGAGLPMPRINAWIWCGGRHLEVDFNWPQQRLVVETDGRTHHGTDRAIRNDPERDRLLMLAGWRVARYTWRDVTEQPDAVAAEVRSLLGA